MNKLLVLIIKIPLRIMIHIWNKLTPPKVNIPTVTEMTYMRKNAAIIAERNE